jgi:hypothetical protein
MSSATLAVARQTGPSPFCYSEHKKIGTKPPQVNAEPQGNARGGCGATPRRRVLPGPHTRGRSPAGLGPDRSGGMVEDQRSDSSRAA